MFAIGRFTGLILSLAISGLTGHALAADKMIVAVGNQGNWENSIPELGQKQGIFAKHGLNVEVLYTQGGAESQQAVISRSVDLGAGIGPAGAMAAFAQGAPIRIIGSSLTGPNDQFWYARADSPIKKPEDMAGKTVSYSTSGSSTNSVVLAFKQRYRIDFKETKTGAAAATFTQVMSGQVDVGWASPPFGLEEIDSGRIRVVARASDIPEFQNQTVRVLIANPDVMKERTDVFKRFFAAYRETVDWMYSDPEALKLYAQIAGVSPGMAKRIRDEFREKKTIEPAQFSGADDIMKDAVKFGYMKTALSKEELEKLVVLQK
ncbi:ABC transporter substrate-binding protein [Neorhizobium sp. DT-125]|uniref:ABC transporter substrate-binding protein n=1 Tax=Neorhizobium sp. DT-125 TaxID=3396163 RepID=UPI003F1B569B